jgi:transcriptional regulator GlxA family with amidase domain
VRRREFLATAAAGAVGLPLAGIAVADALEEDERPKPRPRTDAPPLRVPQEGVVRVGFAVGEHVNVIDTAGPWEVFQDVGAEDGAHNPFRLFTVAETTDPVEATGGLTIVPRHSYADAPQPHVIVVPAHHSTEATLDWLKRAGAKAQLVMSVCTGALILAEAGLLQGRRATTHHLFQDELTRSYPDVRLVRGARYVEDGRIATAAGLTSGIDLALRVVERYLGRPAALATARYMEHETD